MPAQKGARRVSRLGLIIPFALFALLVIGWIVIWFFARNTFEQRVDQWVSAERAAGSKVDFKSKSVGGFPFRLELDVTSPDYQRTDGLKWSGERVQLVVQPWNPSHAIFRFPGMSRLTDRRGLTHTFDVRGASAGSVSVVDGDVRRFALKFDEASLLLFGNPYEVDDLTLNFAPRPEAPDDLMIAADWKMIELERAPRDAPYLGNQLGESRFVGEITQFFPALTAANGEPGGFAKALGAAGGKLTIGQGQFAWGPMKLGVKGDLAFAEKGASGVVGVRLEEPDTLKDAMRKAGYWDAMTQFALMPLEDASANGGFLELKIADNQLLLRGEPVFRLPGTGN